MDAFAAPVGERGDAVAADQLGEPAGKIAAGHQVARLGRQHPAGDQRQRRRGLGARHRRPHRVLVIQQAEKVFAPLANHDTAALLHRVGVEPVELAGDLALQVAGVGRNPHGALVFLGPDARRCDVAQGLADTRAGLGEHGLRLIRMLTRQKGIGDCRGVVGLLRPRLGVVAEQRGEAMARILGADRVVAGWWRQRELLPFIERLPGAHADRAARIGGG